MSDESREQILQEFQNCTGLENLEECIYILEHHQWKLEPAVHEVLERIGLNNDNESTVPSGATNQFTSVEPKPKKTSSDFDQDDDMDDVRIINTVPAHPTTNSSTTPKPKTRDLNFTIEYCDETVNLTLSDDKTVQQLQQKITERLHIPVHQQNFLNWMTKSYDERTVLRDLHLPKENVIRLTASSNGVMNPPRTTTATGSAFREFSVQTGGDFPLNVQYENKSGQSMPISLVLKANTTIREMKQQVEQYTHIPIDQQNWTNLYGAEDGDRLCQTKIPLRAYLLVREKQNTTTTRDTTRSLIRSNTDDDPIPMEHEILIDDDEDDIIVPSGQSSIVVGGRVSDQNKLIPDGCTDDKAALEHFSQVFHRRYGSTALILSMGPLDQAIQESLYGSIENRRPLAIYLHNDQSVCANVFCSQVLAAESIVEYLGNNFVLWAWDITSNSNRQRLLETLRRCVGNQGAQRVDEMETDSFPILLVVTRTRGTLELLEVIEGKSTLNEALMTLIHAHESFDQQRRRDAEEELLREQRERLKQQQEDEYRRSLAADLEKERQKKDDERKQKEEQDEQERKQQWRLQQQRECQARLPEEPSETEKNITRFKIRLPDDEGVLMRRFRISDSLQILFDFLTSQGKMFGEYKLLTTYPKRDLTTLNRTDTFEQLKLYPQEQLILECL